jgi:diacylglycerol kinase (ATP)
MADQGPRGLSRILAATGYSIKGYKAIWINEEAFRQEVTLSAILIPLGLWLGNDPVEQCLLVGVVVLVLIVELLNSAVEAVVDRVSLEQHELAARAKDIGSAAVMTSLFLVVIVWGLLLIPRYI